MDFTLRQPIKHATSKFPTSPYQKWSLQFGYGTIFLRTEWVSNRQQIKCWYPNSAVPRFYHLHWYWGAQFNGSILTVNSTCTAQSLSSFSKLKMPSHQCIPHFLSKKFPLYHSREQPGFWGPTHHTNSNLLIFINILNDFVYHYTRFCYFYYFYSRISRLDF